MSAKDFGAANLIERFAFDQREAINDGYGNVVSGPWVEQFQTRAGVVQIRASEAVMAGRLESRSSIIIQVRRAASTTMRIETDWQARDVRTGTAFNIREVHKDDSREILEILAESNVNTG